MYDATIKKTTNCFSAATRSRHEVWRWNSRRASTPSVSTLRHATSFSPGENHPPVSFPFIYARLSRLFLERRAPRIRARRCLNSLARHFRALALREVPAELMRGTHRDETKFIIQDPRLQTSNSPCNISRCSLPRDADNIARDDPMYYESLIRTTRLAIRGCTVNYQRFLITLVAAPGRTNFHLWGSSPRIENRISLYILCDAVCFSSHSFSAINAHVHTRVGNINSTRQKGLKIKSLEKRGNQFFSLDYIIFLKLKYLGNKLYKSRKCFKYKINFTCTEFINLSQNIKKKYWKQSRFRGYN